MTSAECIPGTKVLISQASSYYKEQGRWGIGVIMSRGTTHRNADNSHHVTVEFLQHYDVYRPDDLIPIPTTIQ